MNKLKAIACVIIGTFLLNTLLIELAWTNPLGDKQNPLLRPCRETNNPRIKHTLGTLVDGDLAQSPTGFELGTEAERAEIRARNRKYLKAKGWWDEIESIRYRPRFIEEDPNLPRIMERIADEMKARRTLWNLFVTPAIVPSENVLRVTDDDINKAIEYYIKSFAYLLQSAFFYSQGEHRRAAEAYQRALRQAEKEFSTLLQETEGTLQEILASIRSMEDPELRQRAEKEMLETIARITTKMKQLPSKRVGLLQFFDTGVISDDLFTLANDIFMRTGDPVRARYLFRLGLDLYEEKSYRTPEDFAINLAYLDMLTNPEAQGVNLLQSVLGIVHEKFTQWSQAQAALQTPLGKRLRAHYKKMRAKTMEASAYVKKRGTAVVLGAGSLVILPLAEMLKERLSDGTTLKYQKILLVELGEGITEQVLDDLIRKGEITAEEAERVQIVRSDATHILEGITTRIDEIISAAKQMEPRKFPREEIAEFFKEIADPNQLVRYALPVDERLLSNDSVNFAVFTSATQDFASPIKNYIDIWSKFFVLDSEDRKTLDQWNKEYDVQIRKNVACLVIEDLSRILTPQGIILFADLVGLQAEAYQDKQEERRCLYGPAGIRELLPKNLPFQTVDWDTWLRPVNVEQGEEERKWNQIIESLILKKETSTGT